MTKPPSEAIVSEDERIDLTQLEDLQSQWKINCTDQYADELFSHWICDRKEEIIAELKKCYEKLDMAESALTEIWACHIDNIGGYNVTEILLYYEKAYGLNIKPEASK